MKVLSMFTATRAQRGILAVLVVLIGSLVFGQLGAIIASLVTGLSLGEVMRAGQIDSPAHNTAVIILQVFLSIGLFGMPALLLPRLLYSRNPFQWLGLKVRFKTGLTGLVLLGFLIGLPLLQYSISLNQAMDLPPAFQEVEDAMRASEDKAAELVKRFTRMDNLGDLAVVLLFTALMPAILEELFFRGLIQRSFVSIWGKTHLAVWLTAILFSSIHGQFYGFIPRMLLGAWLGYLYAYTGNLRYSILGHFINNALSVVSLYLVGKGIIGIDIDKAPAPNVFLAIASAVGVVLLVRLLRKESGRSLPLRPTLRHLQSIGVEPRPTTNSGAWVRVWSGPGPIPAELTLHQLQEAGINAVIVSKQSSAYTFGEVEVHVPIEDLEAARIELSRSA